MQLAEEKLKFVVSLKYLGICVKAFTHFKCLSEHLKPRFYRVLIVYFQGVKVLILS